MLPGKTCYRQESYVAYTISAKFLPRDAILAWCMLSSCVRLSACPSVCHRYCIETTGRIELVLAWRLSFTCPILCCEEIWVVPKVRVIPSGTLSQTPDLENFVTASRSRCRQCLSSPSSTAVELVDDTIRQSTSRGCLLQFDQL